VQVAMQSCKSAKII